MPRPVDGDEKFAAEGKDECAMYSKENSHAVYDTRAPKYIKWALRGAIRELAVKKRLWNGEFWEDGRFARNVGDKATTEVIKKYIQFHRNQELNPKRLELNMTPRPVGG